MNWKLVRSLFSPRNLPLTLAALVSLVFTVIGFVAKDLYQAGISFALAAIATGLLIERQVYLDKTLEQVNKIRNLKGISAFYSCREELPSFEAEIAETDHDVFIVGNIFGRLLAGGFSVLENRLEAGCQVRLLMMDPGPKGAPNPLLKFFGEITDNPLAPEIARSNVEHLRKWRAELSPAKAGRLDVRSYDTMVTVTYLSLDADKPTGKIRIELLPHRLEGTQRPSIELRPGDSGKLYPLVRARYETLWDESPSIFGNRRKNPPAVKGKPAAVSPGAKARRKLPTR